MAGVAFEKFNQKVEQGLESKNKFEVKIFTKALGYLLQGQPDWTNTAIIVTTKKVANLWLENRSGEWHEFLFENYISRL